MIHSLEAAGAERVTSLLANYFASAGESVAIVTFASRASDFYLLHPAIQRIALDPWSETSSRLGRIVSKSLRLILLRRCLARLRPNVVLGEMTTANVLVAMASWPKPRWLLVGTEHVHPPAVSLPVYWEWIRRFIYPRLDIVVAPAAATARWLQARISLKRACSIPNPVVVETGEPTNIDRPSELPVGSRVLLAVGRLHPQKGFDLLLSAFAIANQAEPGWYLAILGDGAERERLLTQSVTLGLADRVLFPGVVKDVGRWYRSADLFALSSRYEGFGNTLAEALAYGLPAVSFDCDAGPGEILRDGIDGYLVPSGDVAAFAARLTTLMKSESLRGRMATAAVEARERFSLERVGSAWRSLIEDGLRDLPLARNRSGASE